MTSAYQKGGHDVISRRKVLLSGDWTCSVRLAPAASALYAALCCICSNVCRLPGGAC